MADQAEKGGEFQYLGGNITGRFLEVTNRYNTSTGTGIAGAFFPSGYRF
jgi:hypothetical protein